MIAYCLPAASAPPAVLGNGQRHRGEASLAGCAAAALLGHRAAQSEQPGRGSDAGGGEPLPPGAGSAPKGSLHWLVPLGRPALGCHRGAAARLRAQPLRLLRERGLRSLSGQFSGSGTLVATSQPSGAMYMFPQPISITQVTLTPPPPPGTPFFCGALLQPCDYADNAGASAAPSVSSRPRMAESGDHKFRRG